MDFTGERYLPEVNTPQIACEHWHRYLYAARFVAGKSVLDIASGEGYGSHLLASTAARVTGVDISAEAVAHASEKYRKGNLEYRVGSAERIPIDGQGIFDLVTSFETIEHIDEVAQRRFLGEVKRLLKSNGQFIVSTPNKVSYSDQADSRNVFHVKELYSEEFMAFLSGSFRHVRFLAQRTTVVSHIADPAGHDGPYAEFGLEFGDDAARPSDKPMEPDYLVAVASDADPIQTGPSLLFDTFGLVIRTHGAIIANLANDGAKLKGSLERLAAERVVLKDRFDALTTAYKKRMDKLKALEATLAARG